MSPTQQDAAAGMRIAGPLAGVRVIDMTTSYAGPTASMYLADLGADVIKVERPINGDDTRGWGPPFVDGVSAWFASANRNKRSVVLDLRSAQGLGVLDELVRSADVLMHNLNPGKLERLQMDPDALRAKNPRLIYCAMSGFGLDGPDNDKPGYDLAAQARSGLMSVTGARGGVPQRVSTAMSDVVTGMCAALAVCAAVVEQQRSGTGDVIDVSLLDSDLALMAPRIAAYVAGEPEPRPSGGTDSVLAVYQAFETADRPLVIAIGNDAMWRRFCLELGLHDLADDPSLATNAGRRESRERLIAAVSQRMSTRTAAEWIERLGEIGVPCSVIQSLSEVVADPQVKARESLMPVPGSDRLVSVRSPFRLGSIPDPRNDPSPELAAHTAEVLTELGHSAAEIDRLVEANAVQVADLVTEGAARA